MHSHPANHSTTVAINALWCLLIALTLLALPLVARQFRLQTGAAPRATETTPAAQSPSSHPVHLTQAAPH